MIDALTTREQVLYLLKKEKELTVNQLAERLGITGMAVRRHLNNLEGEQLVQMATMRKSMGRPVQIFSLSEKGDQYFPRNYSPLALSLLTDIEKIGGRELVTALFQKRKERMADNYQQQIRSSHFAARVQELAAIQNEQGYMVEYEEIDPHTYRFVEYNCPIYDVAQKYQQACHCEIDLFKKVLQTDDVEQVNCISRGEDVCEYIVKKNKEAPV